MFEKVVMMVRFVAFDNSFAVTNQLGGWDQSIPLLPVVLKILVVVGNALGIVIRTLIVVIWKRQQVVAPAEAASLTSYPLIALPPSSHHYTPPTPVSLFSPACLPWWDSWPSNLSQLGRGQITLILTSKIGSTT